MAEVDLEKVRKLAESAQLRAGTSHVHWQATRWNRATSEVAASNLNDYFYWIGHANAYKGIVAMAELATVVEDELDSEGSCP